jgi:hypothetical protein
MAVSEIRGRIVRRREAFQGFEKIGKIVLPTACFFC